MKKAKVLKNFYEYMVPTVMEKTKDGERAYDIYSRLLKDRIIFINDQIEPLMASNIIGQLLFLEKDNPEKDIYMYISSPGGDVNAGLAIFDVMNIIKCDVATIGVGMAASMGAFLLGGGTKGKRYALPNSLVMIHQPSVGSIGGQATDVEIYAKQLIKAKDQLTKYLIQFTGQKREQIEKDIDRDYWMNANEAKAYGIIDEILMYNPGSNNKTKWDAVMQ